MISDMYMTYPVVLSEATRCPLPALSEDSSEHSETPSLYDLIDTLSTEFTIQTPPEMCLTTEETNFIADLRSKHSTVCKRSFPVRWSKQLFASFSTKTVSVLG